MKALALLASLLFTTAAAQAEVIAFGSCPGGILNVEVNGSREMGKADLARAIAAMNGHEGMIVNLNYAYSGTLDFAVGTPGCEEDDRFSSCAEPAGWNALQSALASIDDVTVTCPSADTGDEDETDDGDNSCGQEDEGERHHGEGEEGETGDDEDDGGCDDGAQDEPASGGVIGGSHPVIHMVMGERASTIDIGRALEMVSGDGMWVIVPKAVEGSVMSFDLGVPPACKEDLSACGYDEESILGLARELNEIEGVKATRITRRRR